MKKFLLSLCFVVPSFVFAQESESSNQEKVSLKEEVIEKSNAIMPSWTNGWSRGKVFKQKVGSKNTTLEKGSINYWFVNQFEFPVQYKEEDGSLYDAPRQDAERLEYANAAAKYAQLLSSDIKSTVKNNRVFDAGRVNRIAAISDQVSTEAQFSGFLPVGKAWKKVLRNGKQYWIIYGWYTITKDNYKNAVKSVLDKTDLNEQEKNQVLSSIEKDKEERSADEEDKK